MNLSKLKSGLRLPGASAIVPARNEAECIAGVVNRLLAQRDAEGRPLLREVVVADNGSTDGTAGIARRCGARVVAVAQAGYGNACWEAAKVALGDTLLFVDGDGAADADDAALLLNEIEGGADLVIGVRHKVDPGAMTVPQRWGNALACTLMSGIWRLPATDLGPYRAIRRGAYEALGMRDRSYGWTVEMQVRAHRVGLNVSYVPVSWHARMGGESKISGNLRGVLGAGLGIVGMIARLWWAERQRPAAENERFHPPSLPIFSSVSPRIALPDPLRKD